MARLSSALLAAVLAAVAFAAAPAVAAGASLTASVSSFRNNDPVTVTVNNPNPGGNDVVALYFAGASPDVVKPLKYKWTSTIAGYSSSGSGTLQFNLLNQRQDVQFYLLGGVNATTGFASNLTLAKTAVITNAAPNAPEQGHLALTKNASEMLVQWTTKNASMPVAMWGTSADNLSNTVAAMSKTYNQSDMCGAPAATDGWVDPGMLHVAKLTGLQPSTRYYYQYGQQGGMMSEVYNFVTAAPVGPETTIKWIALADLGHTEIDGSDEYDYDPSGDTLNLIPDGTEEMVVRTVGELIIDNAYQQAGSRKTTDAVYREIEEANASGSNFTLFLLNGDVSYARGMQTQWDVFMDQMQPIGTHVPWMLTNGNHERDFANSGDRFNNATYNGSYDSGGECGVVYLNRFQMPQAPGPQLVRGGYLTRDGASGPYKGPDIVPEWYSYDHGPIHFLVYSTELDFSPGSPQYKFMEADLAAVNRTNTPWVVLNGHRPIYTTNTGGSSPYGVINVARDLRKAIEPLLFQYQVDLTLHGHDHIYERTAPVYKETILGTDANGTSNAPVHVVIGNAGYELSWFYNPFAPGYWRAIALDHGYMRCETSAVKLLCQMISSFTGKLLDEVILTKPAGWQPDLAAKMAFMANFSSNYTPATTLETLGLVSGPYGGIVTPMLADLTADTPLLQQIIEENDLMNKTIDHAIENPDTVVDDCEVLKPAIEIIENQVIQNPETPQASVNLAVSGILPQYKAVCAAAEAYKTSDGIVRPYGRTARYPTPLSEAFTETIPRPQG